MTDEFERQIDALSRAALTSMGGRMPAKREPCQHDSKRGDGTLDCNCLRCGADGYWHNGHRHDEDHPSGKILLRLNCESCA